MLLVLVSLHLLSFSPPSLAVPVCLSFRYVLMHFCHLGEVWDPSEQQMGCAMLSVSFKSH